MRYYFFNSNSKWLHTLHAQRKIFVKWRTSDTFLRRVNLILMFFQDELAIFTAFSTQELTKKFFQVILVLVKIWKSLRLSSNLCVQKMLKLDFNLTSNSCKNVSTWKILYESFQTNNKTFCKNKTSGHPYKHTTEWWALLHLFHYVD